MATRYRTGDLVPVTGIYRVTHNLHRLPHEAVLLANERCPRCAKCNKDVLFELAFPAPDLLPTHRNRIYELPVLEDDDGRAVAVPAKADDRSNFSNR